MKLENLPKNDQLLEAIFDESRSFEERAQLLWGFQMEHNPYIQRYAQALKATGPVSIPISFFKSFDLKCGIWQPETVFESSGTTGQTPSRHFVRDLDLYRRTVLRGFHHFFEPKPYRVLALLPHYLERGNSSLVQMVRFWIEEFGLPGSGFFLHDRDKLQQHIAEAATKKQTILLIGVAYALLDYATEGRPALPEGSLVIETGGMKGRKKELTRPELHRLLKEGLGVAHIHSEYGMTEMMSQAYTGVDGRFRCPPWMHIRISDIHLDRLDQTPGVTGRIHIIDLANIYTCGFFATDDLGRSYPDGSFEVLGRLDTAEMRGCNLMYV